MQNQEVFHLGLAEADISGATLAIIPGDPARVSRIAQLLDNPKELASTREFHSMLGFIDTKPVVICSTGIGGPSTSIAVEELAQLGIRQFLRVGTTGAIQPNIAVGDLIITTASVRLDGASRHFAPIAYPAAADFFATQALLNSAHELKYNAHVGISVSSDTFYPGQERYDTYTGRVIDSLAGSLQQWQSLGVLNYEMESATLFTQCAASGLKAAMVAGVIVNRTEQETPSAELMAQTEQKAVNTVIAAAAKLLV
ncbi:uridine phosphorylase [Celerinatantimonas sp. MCCC 1A17872]|uniref:uridine phosphorylase n=1 Tax=Celerinatantimonas sp. MCCC 1A17872 TaxID=3177514 RepID=UPI0038C5AAAC